MNILKQLFSANEREIKRFFKVVEQINSLESGIKSLTDEQISYKTVEFRTRLTNGETLDDLLPEAFAVVREASIRTLGLRHFDVQLIGGMVLHQGRIAEMKTGEGKTLVATLPLYLNALSGKGAHLVTVNDFLSKRDTRWNGPVFHFLGLTVGSIHGQSAETGTSGGSYVYDPEFSPDDPNMWDCLRPVTRREAYACDITYGTNHEFGFDYLRDNMVFREQDLSQRELNYAIVDEVDSILVDEARTPLIISGHGYKSSDMYYKVDKLVRRLTAERDYTVDEKAKTAMLTEDGTHKIEELTGCGNLSDPENLELNQYVNAALKAHYVFRKDIDYVVKDGQVIIVDEFTGRLMFGRRWSDGLHQSVEAKEGCNIQEENQTLATVTYQNYFRLYNKLAGMTGTALTEEAEFRKIYALDVVEIPTNRPVIRKDHPDVIFKTEDAKFRGITLEVLSAYTREQPTLVGTRSIEVSERVSERLISERLQLLAMTVILHDAIEKTSGIPNDEKQQMHAALNMRFEELDVPRLGKIAKRCGVDPNPLSDQNLDKFSELAGIFKSGRAKLYEALKEGIVHNVLNAKFHEQEAEIISQAGRRGAVTIATNMAGRGVDITLGGKDEDEPGDEGAPFEMSDMRWDFAFWKQRNPDKYEEAKKKPEMLEVMLRGGLYVIGSERHESRRIDNQLRGRSGRQGDPGESKFFVSLQDELQRLFGDRSNSALLGGWREDEPMDARLLSKVIERAQKKVEMHHFEMRKHVLEYDDVMNLQRETIYSQRRKILEGADLRPTVISYLEQMVTATINHYCPEGMPIDEWDMQGLFDELNQSIPLELYIKPEDLKSIRKKEELEDALFPIIEKSYEVKEQEIGVETMRDIERHIALDLINRKWIEHLEAMDYLREGISLRGYAQRDPIIEYKKEAYDLFQHMMDGVQEDMCKIMYRVQTERVPERRRPSLADVQEISSTGPTGLQDGNPAPVPQSVRHGAEKIGRNDPCPCGSGKKYKKCCLGKIDL